MNRAAVVMCTCRSLRWSLDLHPPPPPPLPPPHTHLPFPLPVPPPFHYAQARALGSPTLTPPPPPPPSVQEFASFLLDGLHEDLNRQRGPKEYIEDVELDYVQRRGVKGSCEQDPVEDVQVQEPTGVNRHGRCERPRPIAENGGCEQPRPIDMNGSCEQPRPIAVNGSCEQLGEGGGAVVSRADAGGESLRSAAAFSGDVWAPSALSPPLAPPPTPSKPSAPYYTPGGPRPRPSEREAAAEEEAVAAEAWGNYLRRDRSVIVDMFQGQLRSVLKCSHCGAPPMGEGG